MSTYLSEIVARHRARAAADERDLDALLEAARACPATRGFAAALRAEPGLSVVAEVKRRSPSKGALAPDLDPASLGAAYAAGGAAALSVLTDEVSFGARPGDLAAARAASGLPTLRKDFTVAAADVADARLMGADAVLLIVAALDAGELGALHSLAAELGLDALVEVHDEAELEVALDLGATLIGVNQRDLVTFEVDHGRAARLAAAIPDALTAVAESGVAGPGDGARLAGAGYQAVLVGEHLVRAADPAAAVAALRAAPVAGDRAGARVSR